MKKANVKTASVVVALPEFDSGAIAIIKAHEVFDKASARLFDVVNYTMQSYVDKCNKAGVAKDEASVIRLGKTIRESQAVLDIVASGAMERKTFTEYANSAMRAFFYGVPFEGGLKNKPEYILPWSKSKHAADDTNSTTGKVVVTTRAELDKTLCKALEQARALGLLNFAAELVDLATESLDGFTE
jgi:hypothetical protein